MIMRERAKEQKLRRQAAIRNTQAYYRNYALTSDKSADQINSQFVLPPDKKQKKGKDYFYVMRKLVCFLMFLLFTASVALVALPYLEIVPEYTAFMVQPDYEALQAGAEAEDEEDAVEAAEEGEDEEEDDIIEAPENNSIFYNAVDPIFGIIKKYVGLELGESPLYDQMAAKAEVGYANAIAGYIVMFFPAAILIFAITALICLIKAFLGMFGKRIFKGFGLGALIMLICGAVMLFAGVFYNMEISTEGFDFSGLMPFATSYLLVPEDISAAPVIAAGFGLLGMVALPVLNLLLSILARKKVPFSIFD